MPVCRYIKRPYMPVCRNDIKRPGQDLVRICDFDSGKELESDKDLLFFSNFSKLKKSPNFLHNVSSDVNAFN